MVVGGKSGARGIFSLGKSKMASSSAQKNGRNGWREIAAKISSAREESVVVLCRGRQMVIVLMETECLSKDGRQCDW